MNRVCKTGDEEEMVCIRSELRFAGVRGERALWIYWTLNLASGGSIQTDRMTDRPLWLFWLGFAVRKMNGISNYVLGDTCCDTLG